MSKEEDYYKIGYIHRPHGLKGDLTITLEEEAPEDFSEIESLFVLEQNRFIPYFIEELSIRDSKAFLKLEEVDSVDAANKICKHAIYLPKSTRPRSGRGEFYDDEVIDFEVIDDTETVLGKITSVTKAGLNHLLVVEDGEKEILIPVNAPFITSVNKTKKIIHVSLPDGFLDL